MAALATDTTSTAGTTITGDCASAAAGTASTAVTARCAGATLRAAAFNTRQAGEALTSGATYTTDAAVTDGYGVTALTAGTSRAAGIVDIAVGADATRAARAAVSAGRAAITT